MKFPQNFLAGAGVSTVGAGVLTARAGAGAEITRVCTALLSTVAGEASTSISLQTFKTINFKRN